MSIQVRVKAAVRKLAAHLHPATCDLERRLHALNNRIIKPKGWLRTPTGFSDLRRLALDYLVSMRVARNGEFLGYRHSASTRRPVLYATVAALLLKHLLGVRDHQVEEELALVCRHQSDDGLFRDSVIDCPVADAEDWWGWRHLTLHSLMALALFEVPAPKEINYLQRFRAKDQLRQYLRGRDWGKRAAWTSNEVQNLGVMLQYARDSQNWQPAGDLLDVMFEEIDGHQDKETGLYGCSFRTPEELSLGVQAGYHFWLLHFYDRRPVPHMERIIDNALRTQNLMGGYGVQWNSSACEDIDSIDPLLRLARLTPYRRNDIQASLSRALPALLQNLNPDGGWVFRRHEALTVVHPQMYSAAQESNVFYTWFRMLGLAYCLQGLESSPADLAGTWHFKRCPGHQFL